MSINLPQFDKATVLEVLKNGLAHATKELEDHVTKHGSTLDLSGDIEKRVFRDERWNLEKRQRALTESISSIEMGDWFMFELALWVNTTDNEHMLVLQEGNNTITS